MIADHAPWMDLLVMVLVVVPSFWLVWRWGERVERRRREVPPLTRAQTDRLVREWRGQA